MASKKTQPDNPVAEPVVTDATTVVDPGGAQHPSRLSGADGMRAIAALLVVFSHLFQRLGMWGQPEWLTFLQSVMLKGAFGVSIFFVLSGLLLSMPFWRAYFTGAPRPKIGHYVRRRAARIIPGYWASLIVSFWVATLLFPDAPAAIGRLIAGFTFTSGFHWLTFFPTESNGPLWSISFEVFSYVLMPLAMIAMFAIGRRGYKFSALFWAVVFAVVIAINQVVITMFQTTGPGKGWEYGFTGGAKEWMPYYNPVGFFGHFCIGIIAAGIIVWWQLRGGRRLWRFDLLALLGFGLLIGMIVNVSLTPPMEPTFLDNFQGQPYMFPMYAGAAALALIGMSHSRVVGRVLDNPFFRYTAKVSFGIYIWHYLLLYLMEYLTNGEFVYGNVHDPARWAAMAGILLVLTYAVATLSWKLLEKPVLYSKWATRP